MKLIIDIDEELYEAYKGKPPMLGDEGMDMIAQAIANGIPLESRLEGAWIIKYDHEGFWYECNICGFRPSELTGICPHCNADMGGAT